MSVRLACMPKQYANTAYVRGNDTSHRYTAEYKI